MKFFRFVFGSTATAAKGVINRGFCSCIFMTGSSKADVWHEINARAKTACLKGWAGWFSGRGAGEWDGISCKGETEKQWSGSSGRTLINSCFYLPENAFFCCFRTIPPNKAFAPDGKLRDSAK